MLKPLSIADLQDRSRETSILNSLDMKKRMGNSFPMLPLFTRFANNILIKQKQFASQFMSEENQPEKQFDVPEMAAIEHRDSVAEPVVNGNEEPEKLIEKIAGSESEYEEVSESGSSESESESEEENKEAETPKTRANTRRERDRSAKKRD